jgi:photosystem II stability/assembly factor-like uncharacterized protein
MLQRSKQRGGGWSGARVWLVWLACHAAAGSTVAAQDSGSNEGRDVSDFRELGLVEPPADVPHWHQILATPRLGGKLSAVTVDPRNTNRIFVGTEEGTLLRSTDGGITWVEFDTSPFVTFERSVGVLPPPKPDSKVAPPLSYNFFVDPPFSKYIERLEIPFQTHFMALKPEFIRTGFFPGGPVYSSDFIHEVAKSKKEFVNPVQRIMVCPGSTFPLILTTKREMLGSDDDGITFTRLYTVQSPGQMYHAVCDQKHPNEMIVGNDFGGFHSSDGGFLWEPITMGRGEAITVSAIYMDPLPGEKVHVAVIADDFVYHGDPNNKYKRLKYIYPNWADLDTAPWARITWGIITKSGQMWFSTADGLRASEDNTYNHWKAVETPLFNKRYIGQVELGANSKGGERIAVMMKDWIYATDNYGKSWFPFFFGTTRRDFRQMVAAPPLPGVPPRWWVITQGQLFASVVPKPSHRSTVDYTASRWAKKLLHATPPLEVVINAALHGTLLGNDEVAAALDRIQDRNWVPSHFTLSMNFFQMPMQRQSIVTEGFPDMYNRLEQAKDTFFSLFAQGIWEIRDTPIVVEKVSQVRNSVHEIRRQASFVVEDAYHERQMHLNRIAEGMDDRVQIDTLKERIRGLEAVIEVWTRAPLSKLYLLSKEHS